MELVDLVNVDAPLDVLDWLKGELRLPYYGFRVGFVIENSVLEIEILQERTSKWDSNTINCLWNRMRSYLESAYALYFPLIYTSSSFVLREESLNYSIYHIRFRKAVDYF
jgi:hypothetical protein